jgi:hypothetical protein
MSFERKRQQSSQNKPRRVTGLPASRRCHLPALGSAPRLEVSDEESGLARLTEWNGGIP